MKKLLFGLAVLLAASSIYAASPWRECLANAIYKAEGGAASRHPYGILAKYKTTTPRQACLNTIARNLKQWKKAGRPGEFIDFMARSFCPVGALNDPTDLNKNWPGNVKKFMTAQKQSTNPTE